MTNPCLRMTLKSSLLSLKKRTPKANCPKNRGRPRESILERYKRSIYRAIPHTTLPSHFDTLITRICANALKIIFSV